VELTACLEHVVTFMIEGKLLNIILDEAKNTGDAVVSTRLFNEMQNNIYCL